MNTNKKQTVMNLLKSLITLSLFLLTTQQAYGEENITYYHYDLLGSPIVTTNELGEVVWREAYTPYGKKLLNQDQASDNVRGYTGHVFDEETSLTYMQARYYDAEIGRFMGMDPVGFKEDNPIMFNRYAYANNNPYKYVDPNGENPAAVIGFAIGALAGLISYGMTTDEFDIADAALEGLTGGINGGITGATFGLGPLGLVGKAFVSGTLTDAAKNGFKKGKFNTDMSSSVKIGVANTLGFSVINNTPLKSVITNNLQTTVKQTTTVTKHAIHSKSKHSNWSFKVNNGVKNQKNETLNQVAQDTASAGVSNGIDQAESNSEE